MKRIDVFLVSPVRKPKLRLVRRLLVQYGLAKDAYAEEQQKIATYVKNIEAQGRKVYWPFRDTDQNDDPIGTRICGKNRMAIYQANEIHIWYSKGSQGSLFDTGMLFAFALIADVGSMHRQRIVLANPEAVQRTPHKSFENVILALTGNL